MKSPLQKSSSFNGTGALIAFQSLLFVVFGSFTQSSYAPLAPFIKNSYLLDSAELGLITSIVYIGSSSVSFFAGAFVDGLGPARTIRIAFAIMAFGSLIAALSHSYIVLVGGFYAIGFGNSLVTPSTNRAVMEEYYPNHAIPMGIKQSGVPVGAALSAVVLPLVAIHFGLQWTFVITLALGTVISLLVGSRKKEKLELKRQKGYMKQVLSAGRNNSLMILSISAAFLSWGQQSLLTYYVVFLENRGFLITISEIFLALLLAGAVTGRIFWVSLSNRMFQKNRLKVLVLIMMISSLLFLIFPTASVNLVSSGSIAFFVGMSAAGWNSIYVTIISEIAPRSKVGMFSGLSLMIMSIGTIIGTPIAGFIQDSTHSYIDMWLVVGFTLFVAAILLLFAEKRFRIYRVAREHEVQT
jgi:MFS family permease